MTQQHLEGLGVGFLTAAAKYIQITHLCLLLFVESQIFNFEILAI